MTPVAAAIRLLLVEDDPINRQLVRAVLSRAPGPALREAELEEAATLAAARAALGQRPPMVVMLDVRLPDGNGLELARELARTADGPHVVVMSASVLPGDRQAALDAGCDAFLAKPFRPADLVDLLTTWVG